MNSPAPRRRRPPPSQRLTGAVLAAWRAQMGFSQRDACRELNCARGAWGRWEAGRQRIPRYIGLACDALALGVDSYRESRGA